MGSGSGWFSYGAPPASKARYVARSIRHVTIQEEPYGGPFWSDHGELGSNYADLAAWTGLTQSLFDDVMLWHDEYQRDHTGWTEEQQRHHHRARIELLRRLAEQVFVGIRVDVDDYASSRGLHDDCVTSPQSGVRSTQTDAPPSAEGPRGG